MGDLKVAVFDLETDGLLPEVTRIWCAVVKDIHTNEKRRFTPSDINSLAAYLAGFDVLIGHNVVGYDFPVLRKVLGFEYTGVKVDTLLMSRTQRPNRLLPPDCPYRGVGPHSIAAWGWRLGHHKVDHNDWSQYSEAMLHRCDEDVEINHQVYDALLKEGAGEGWTEAHKLNNKLFHYLQRQEEYGWLVDKSRMDRAITTLDRWIGRIDGVVVPLLPDVVEVEESKKAGIQNWVRKPFKKDGTYAEIAVRWLATVGQDVSVGGPFSRVAFRKTNLDSIAELKDFLLAEGWEPAEWNTDDSGNRTSPKFSKDDLFEGINGKLGRLVARRVQCRQRRSTIEGWLGNIRPDGRISPVVAGIASTGRLRHSVIVNVPSPDARAFFAKEMRSFFVARPGWVLVGTDSKGNQMRQLAARMDDDEFTHAVLHGTKETGDDLHSLNQKRSGVATRTLAKNFFYGCILFGAGDRKTAKIIRGTVEEARAKKEEYFREMPKLRELLDREIKAWRKTARTIYNPRFNRMEYKDGYISGLDGRPIMVEFEKDILVYYLQSDEAIQMAAAYCVLHKWLEMAGYVWQRDYGFVIWMHDEWQLECRPEISNHVQSLSNEAIAWAGRYYKIACPHEGESKVGVNWCQTH